MNSNMFPNLYSSNNKFVGPVNNAERHISQFCEYRVELSNQLDEITHVQSLLAGADIWPDQCEYAIQTLAMMRKTIRNLFSLLNSISSLTPEIKINRYSMIVESQQVDKQIGDLISLLAKYRDLINVSIKRNNKEQYDINNKIGQIGEKCAILVQSLDRIINQVMSLNPKVC